MPSFFPRVVLALLALIVALGSSSALTLCVHDGQAFLEPSWAMCCQTSTPCCEAEACAEEAPAEPGLASGEDCQDYVLALTSEWVPGDPAGAGTVIHAIAWRALPVASVADLCPRRLLPPGLLGVPPPVRAQRTPILRC